MKAWSEIPLSLFRKGSLAALLLLLAFSAPGAEAKYFFPEGLKTLRGLILFYADGSTAAKPMREVDADWKEAAKVWGFGTVLISRDMDAPKLGAVLQELAATTGHSELPHLPFVTLGMSWSAGTAYDLAAAYPDRCIAAGIVCIAKGDMPAAGSALAQTPLVYIVGDGNDLEATALVPLRARRNGARWGLAVQWNNFHQYAKSGMFLAHYFDQCIRLRLPADYTGAAKAVLREIPEAEGWIGIRDQSFKSDFPVIMPYPAYTGDGGNTFWWPSEASARAFRAFGQMHEGLYDSTQWKRFGHDYYGPFNIGSTEPGFELSSPSPSFNQPRLGNENDSLVLMASNSLPVKPAMVEFYDGDLLLGRVVEPPYRWTVRRLAPGYHGFHALAHYPDGRRRTTRLGTYGIRYRKPVFLELAPIPAAKRLAPGSRTKVTAVLRGEGTASKVVFLLDDKVVSTDAEAPYLFEHTAPAQEASQILSAYAVLASGDTVQAFPAALRTVVPRPASLTLRPRRSHGGFAQPVGVAPGQTLPFTGLLRDQEGYPLPGTVTYKVSGGGALSTASGAPVFTAGNAVGGPFTVTAQGAGLEASALVEVTNTLRIAFRPGHAPTPPGFIADNGAAYGPKADGRTFGWNRSVRWATLRPDHAHLPAEYTSYITMHGQEIPPYNKTYFSIGWEMAVENGDYSVRVVMGDANNRNDNLPLTMPRVEPDSHFYKVLVESTLVVDGRPTEANPWVMGEAEVKVTDGRLSIANAPGQKWNKICFVEIAPKGALGPVVGLKEKAGARAAWNLQAAAGRGYLEVTSSEPFALKVRDLRGREVGPSLLPGGTGSAGVHRFSTASWQPGIHLVELRAGGRRQIRRVYLGP